MNFPMGWFIFRIILFIAGFVSIFIFFIESKSDVEYNNSAHARPTHRGGDKIEFSSFNLV